MVTPNRARSAALSLKTLQGVEQSGRDQSPADSAIAVSRPSL